MNEFIKYECILYYEENEVSRWFLLIIIVYNLAGYLVSPLFKMSLKMSSLVRSGDEPRVVVVMLRTVDDLVFEAAVGGPTRWRKLTFLSTIIL